MIGDYPSKPLQGKKFRKHRKAMMNEEQGENHDISLDNRSVLEHELREQKQSK